MAPESNAALNATECMSEDEVLAFAAGDLSASAQHAAHLHLDQCDTCQRVLSEAVRALAPTTAASSDPIELAWGTTLRPDTIIGGRYVVRRFIARGGMGEVYEAFDRELQQRVALKTVTSTACDNPSAVRRLKAEVQLARRVSHRNVCRIYDFGTHMVPGTTVPISFLTMEFVDGETLGQRIRRDGALEMDEARRLGRELLLGLKAAHDAGVLHRDFKSDNVMLRMEGDRAEPLILDFGLARALDHQEGQSSVSHGNLVGTMAYIAPEQLQGQAYTTASDVYSFGIVWFEMLTGELPFEGAAALKFAPLKRLSYPPPAPSSKRSDVPGDLDEIVLACLRRSPDDRLQTASDVLQRLDQLETRARSQPPRSKAVPVLAAAALVVVGGYTLLGRPSSPPRVATASGPSSAAMRSESPRPAAAVAAVAAPSAAASMEPVTDAAPRVSGTTSRPTSAASSVPSYRAQEPNPRVSTPPSRSTAPATASSALSSRASVHPPSQPPSSEQPSDHAASTEVPGASDESAGGWENPF